MDRNNILTEFKKYTDQYNPEDVKVKLKIDHSRDMILLVNI
jgi:hypothetical protein